MKTLKDFLHERAEIERGRADEKTAIQQGWIGSLHRLIQQIKAWLQDADEEHLLKVVERYYELGEIEVGVYTAPGLIIRLEAREVRVVPVARMVVGPFLSDGMTRMNRSFGRVDMTDGGDKLMLFRTRKDPSDEWVIVEQVGYTIRKLDRQAFEEALLSLLE